MLALSLLSFARNRIHRHIAMSKNVMKYLNHILPTYFLLLTVTLKILFRIQIISHIPVAIAQLNSSPKHMVISLIIPHVTIQLIPQHTAKSKIAIIATIPPCLILSFIALSSPIIRFKMFSAISLSG